MRHAPQSVFKLLVCMFLIMSVFLLTPGIVFADKTSVSISAPSSAKPGSQITIRVTATHSANNFLHYTDWLYVMINGKEIARWNYTRSNKPESKIFTKEITYTVYEALEITAEGHCNMHGSKGPATAKVILETAAASERE